MLSKTKKHYDFDRDDLKPLLESDLGKDYYENVVDPYKFTKRSKIISKEVIEGYQAMLFSTSIFMFVNIVVKSNWSWGDNNNL